LADPFSIRLQAVVSDGELPAVQAASDRLARLLSDASGKPWTCTCSFSQSIAEIDYVDDHPIVITSMSLELTQYK